MTHPMASNHHTQVGEGTVSTLRRSTSAGKRRTANVELVARPSETLRRHERISVDIRAVLYHGVRFKGVMIRNISNGGAGIEGCGSLMPNDRISIRLLNGRTIDAVVRWWFAGVCGVQFMEPLAIDDCLLRGTIS